MLMCGPPHNPVEMCFIFWILAAAEIISNVKTMPSDKEKREIMIAL